MKKLKLSLILIAKVAILLALGTGCVSPRLIKALAENNSTIELDAQTTWGNVKLRRTNPPKTALPILSCAQCPICCPRPTDILDLPTGQAPKIPVPSTR